MRTVLLIDDDQSILVLVSTFLQQAGFRTLTAPDGRAGLNLFVSERPDVVLCDLYMPEMGGLAVLEEIKRLSPLTPFVVFSGTNDVKLAAEALRNGAWDYLIKPLPGLELLPPLIERMEERALFLREKESAQSRLEEQVKLRTAQLLRQLKEKDTLLAEVHHRVKNNLQIILVLLGLQHDHADESQTRDALQASRDRIHALAMVQDEMHDADHAILVDSLGYLTGMVHHLLSAQGLTSKVKLKLKVEPLSLRPSLAFSCGLILNELMNGLGKGEPPREAWDFEVGFRSVGPGAVELSLSDSRSPWSSWMPEAGKTTLGWDLVSALAGGTGGALNWDPRDPNRVTVRMT